ncbi:hypothetical protein BGZ96_010807 [Linnemannia gamsii]|uniref:Uncharacterized protein n=1 Tax=Linnemannia gamsii TaxID=64522 RepID=A0ABQ7JU74_9FUNG|nr:hypothetical protein BGZ96_010807 [Linnemannia gamsii]
MHSNNIIFAAFILILTLVATARAVTWDPSFCSWEGSLPLCNSDCPGRLGNELRCTTEKKSCFNGHKGLCCPSKKQAICCQVMNGLRSSWYDTYKEFDPDKAKEFYAECEAMRNSDQRH